jgi:hypothetical protein
MKRLLTIVLVALPCVIACGSNGLPLGSGGSGGSAGHHSPSEFESFDYRMISGPCPPGGFCNESISVAKSGKLERDSQGSTRTVTLSTQDVLALAEFATSDPLLLALADPTPCHSPVSDMDQVLTITLTSQAPLQKSIVTCRGEPWDSAQAWLQRLRDYFPASDN